MGIVGIALFFVSMTHTHQVISPSTTSAVVIFSAQVINELQPNKHSH